MSFAGLRVLSLESRRANETAELIRRNGGEPFVAPSMREVPNEENQPALKFAERLLAREFEMLILLTGVGTRYLVEVISKRHPLDTIVAALKEVTIVARGPKPAAALRDLGMTASIFVPEPNTWRELLQAIESRPERRIAVQEYGRSGPELIDALKARGAEVTVVPVYRYAMPHDVQPLRDAVAQLAKGVFDVTLWTSSQQLIHLMDVGTQMGLASELQAALRKTMVASIGPVMSETLIEYGIPPDIEPSHPKLGILVKEAAEKSEELLCRRKT